MTTIIQFLWQYFYRNGMKYKTNQTNKVAWCKACLKGNMYILSESNTTKTRAGQLLAVQSQEDLQKSGLSLEIEGSERARLTRDLALENVAPVCGKAERMLPHIKICKYISTDDCTLIILTCKPLAALINNISPPSPSTSLCVSSTVTPIPLSTQNSARPIKRSKSLHGVSPGGIQHLTHTLSASQLQEEFSADLCKLLIALNTAWVAAESPSLHRFVHKWVGPEVIVEDRQILSG